MLGLKKILFPTDFSEHARSVVPHAIEMAKKFNAEVFVLHVVHEPVYAAQYQIELDPHAVRKSLTESSETQLAELAKEFEAEGVRVKTQTVVGAPFVEIIRVAREEDVGLVMLGSHGGGAIKHMLLGSTAERVVRKARRPVLIVRGTDEEFEIP